MRHRQSHQQSAKPLSRPDHTVLQHLTRLALYDIFMIFALVNQHDLFYEILISVRALMQNVNVGHVHYF